MIQKRHIGYEIRTLSNLLRRQIGRLVHSPIEDDSLTDMQGMIVDYLYENQNNIELFQKDIEARFSIRRSTASGILGLMEKKGIITRQGVKHDARLKKIMLSQNAIGMHEKIESKIEEVEAIISKGLTEQEIQSFFEIVAKIKKNIE